MELSRNNVSLLGVWTETAGSLFISFPVSQVSHQEASDNAEEEGSGKTRVSGHMHVVWDAHRRWRYVIFLKPLDYGGSLCYSSLTSSEYPHVMDE